MLVFWSDNDVVVIYAVAFYPGTLCMTLTYVFVSRIHFQRHSQRITQRQMLIPALGFSTVTSPMTDVNRWLPNGVAVQNVEG